MNIILRVLKIVHANSTSKQLKKKQRLREITMLLVVQHVNAKFNSANSRIS